MRQTNAPSWGVCTKLYTKRGGAVFPDYSRAIHSGVVPVATLLALNPNTSVDVTARIGRALAPFTPPDGKVRLATARFGAPYLASEAGVAVAGHAVLDAVAHDWQAAGCPDGVLIACFGDPGLQALRELMPVPVSGLAEAAMIEASALGRYGVITGGAAWKPMLERLAIALGLQQGLEQIATVAPSGAQLAADPDGAVSLLVSACRQMLDAAALDAIVVGGAGLAGLAARMQPLVPVPLICSVQAGARQAWARMASDRSSAPVLPDTRAGWTGISPALDALLSRQP